MGSVLLCFCFLREVVREATVGAVVAAAVVILVAGDIFTVSECFPTMITLCEDVVTV